MAGLVGEGVRLLEAERWRAGGTVAEAAIVGDVSGVATTFDAFDAFDAFEAAARTASARAAAAAPPGPALVAEAATEGDAGVGEYGGGGEDVSCCSCCCWKYGLSTSFEAGGVPVVVAVEFWEEGFLVKNFIGEKETDQK